MKHLIFFFAGLLILASCEKEKACREKPLLSNPGLRVKVSRLEKELFAISKPDDIRSFTLNHPQLAEAYMGFSLKDSNEFYKGLYGFYTNPQLKEFYEHGEKINNGFQGLEENISDLFRHIHHYFPNYPIPEVNTLVSGFFNQDFLIEDSLVVISIDYFYGDKAKYRPNEYAYMLSRRKQELLVPALAFRIGLEQFARKDGRDETLLNDMVSWGKVCFFMEKVMPCVPDSAIIMYSEKELNDVNRNMDIIWGHFIENKLFYETKNDIKRRYVEEAPKVAVIGDKCPGRIGRYIGWQIVKAYMEKNPEVTLADLMDETDAQKIFKLSKYKPKVR